MTGSLDTTARIWEASTGLQLRSLSGHTSQVNAAAFSPDGEFIVTGSEDRTARIWNVSVGEEVHLLEGHGSGVNAAAFSDDGDFVVTLH